jgi:hypothetical protein
MWTLATAERATGFVRVTADGSALRVAVGDRPRPVGTVPTASGLVTAELAADGSVVVETVTAPPALLVSCDGARLLPAAPGQCQPTATQPGDLLILCSASALDAPPAGLVEILRHQAQEVLAMSPQDLLTRLLDAVEDGAAAVIARTSEGGAHEHAGVRPPGPRGAAR